MIFNKPEKENTMHTMKILLALISLTAILPVFAVQTTEKNPQIKWDFSMPAIQCMQWSYPFINLEITGKFETYVDLSDDATAKGYIQQEIDAAIKRCPNIITKQGLIQISLYGPKNEKLIEAQFNLTSKKLEYRNYARESLESLKAQKKAEEEIAQRMKEGGFQIDWEIKNTPLGVDITGKFKNAVDLSDDVTAKRFINVARDIVLLKYPKRAVTIYLFSPKGPQDKYYILASNTSPSGELKYINYAAQYAAVEKERGIVHEEIINFMRQNKVKVWFDTFTKLGQLQRNPFQFEEQIIGFTARFERMIAKDRAIFTVVNTIMPEMIVKNVLYEFANPNKIFLLAGKIRKINATSEFIQLELDLVKIELPKRPELAIKFSVPTL